MRLLAILAFLGFISSLLIHLIVLLGLALLGVNLLQNDLWVGLLFIGVLVILLGMLFTGSLKYGNQSWDAVFAVIPEWTKRGIKLSMRYAYISMAVVAMLLILSGTAGGDLKAENGKYFFQEKSGLRRELTAVEYNVSKSYQDAGTASLMSLIYLSQAICAYGGYIILKQCRH